MKRGLGLSAKEMSDVFAEWNKGVLDSFLIEITRDVLRFNDDDGTPLVEKILDSAGQKGTGKWTAINALDLGMPVTLIGEAVFARCLSSLKQERGRAAGVLTGPSPKFEGDKKKFLADLEQALYASKIISYAQGFMLIQNVRLSRLFCLLYSTPSVALLNSSVGCHPIQMEAQQTFNCTDVARRLHYSIGVLEGHHFCVPQEPRPREFAIRRLLQQSHPQGSGWLERYCQQGGAMGYPYPCF